MLQHITLYTWTFSVCFAVKSINLRLVNFSKHKNVRPLTNDIQVDRAALSRVECAVYCQFYVNCVATSYNIIDKACFMHVNTSVAVEADCGWDFMYRIGTFVNYKWSGHDYYFSKDEQNWTNAQETCFTIGSNLVKIENSAENVWIASVIKGLHKSDTWIGAYDMSNNKTWFWVSDNSLLTYFDWAQGEPNYNKGEGCVIIWSDRYATALTRYHWNDYLCNMLCYFVCENNY